MIILNMMFVHRRIGKVTEGVKCNSEWVRTLGNLRLDWRTMLNWILKYWFVDFIKRLRIVFGRGPF